MRASPGPDTHDFRVARRKSEGPECPSSCHAVTENSSTSWVSCSFSFLCRLLAADCIQLHRYPKDRARVPHPFSRPLQWQGQQLSRNPLPLTVLTACHWRSEEWSNQAWILIAPRHRVSSRKGDARKIVLWSFHCDNSQHGVGKRFVGWSNQAVGIQE